MSDRSNAENNATGSDNAKKGGTPRKATQGRQLAEKGNPNKATFKKRRHAN
jgi:hypothetical protein